MKQKIFICPSCSKGNSKDEWEKENNKPISEIVNSRRLYICPSCLKTINSIDISIELYVKIF